MRRDEILRPELLCRRVLVQHLAVVEECPRQIPAAPLLLLFDVPCRFQQRHLVPVLDHAHEHLQPRRPQLRAAPVEFLRRAAALPVPVNRPCVRRLPVPAPRECPDLRLAHAEHPPRLHLVPVDPPQFNFMYLVVRRDLIPCHLLDGAAERPSPARAGQIFDVSVLFPQLQILHRPLPSCADVVLESGFLPRAPREIRHLRPGDGADLLVAVCLPAVVFDRLRVAHLPHRAPLARVPLGAELVAFRPCKTFQPALFRQGDCLSRPRGSAAAAVFVEFPAYHPVEQHRHPVDHLHRHDLHLMRPPAAQILPPHQLYVRPAERAVEVIRLRDLRRAHAPAGGLHVRDSLV